MKEYAKKALIYILVAVGAYGIMLLFLVLSAKVSKDSIQENMEESAAYLCEDVVYPYYEGEGKEIKHSCIDRYADSILLNIVYNFESDNSLKSVMISSYYYDDYMNENQNLYKAVFNGLEKNKQYLRYWHGSAGIMRIFHTFMSIKQIYIWHGVLLTLLFVVLAFLLVRVHCAIYAVLFGISLLVVSIWYVPFSVEYTWPFLCMFFFSILAVILVDKGKDQHIGILFMLSGMVTIFLDFLTTETVSLLIPLMLTLVVRRKRKESSGVSIGKRNNGIKEDIIYSVKSVILWGIGYIGMWLMKWITAAIVLGENVMPYITEHIEERMAGELGDMSLLSYIMMAIKRNITCLIPLDYGLTGAIIAGLLVVVMIYIMYVYHKKIIDWKYIILLFALGLVPIIRIIILRNHSVLHCFFVHRALVASVFAFFISAVEIIEIKKKNNRH
ncbi:MAG: hypothetical protein J5372_09360 [Lachnospiraceae bacterium]|nr:hypothetical protein [Lachnospiraceae bacterium]